MENGSVLAAVLYNWAPILLMIGFWLWIMRKVGGSGQRNYTERSIASWIGRNSCSNESPLLWSSATGTHS